MSAPSWWAWPAIGVLLAIGAAVLAYETRGTTFWADEWTWILTRRGGGLGTFLDPHNSHFSLVPVIVYKLLFATAGLRHYWPYRAVLIGADLGCALLVFIYARARVGGYLAILAAALILFFGPGWQDILWPFQMAWLFTIGAGVAALLALDRGDRKGDIVACVLLCVSLASSSIGLAVAIGLVVEVLQRRRWRDLWIVGIPIGLYALWWLGYQQSMINGHAFLLLPQFVFNSAAGVLSAVAGLVTVNVSNDTGSYLSWGPVLLGLALVAFAWRAVHLRGIPPRAVTLISTALAFWILTAIGRAYITIGPLVVTENGDQSRYLYVGAILVLLLAAELARGYSPSLVVRAVAGLLVVASIASNSDSLRDGASLLRTEAQQTRTELGTLDISAPVENPGYVSNGFVFGVVTPRAWFAAKRVLGSDAFDAAQIAAAPEFARQAADMQLIQIQRLGLAAAPVAAAQSSPPAVDSAQNGTVSVHGNCVSYRPAPYTPAGAANALALTVPAGGLLLRNGGVPASVGARRFDSQFAHLGTLAAGGSGVLRIKQDLAPQPWHAQIAANGPFVACGLGA